MMLLRAIQMTVLSEKSGIQSQLYHFSWYFALELIVTMPKSQQLTRASTMVEGISRDSVSLRGDESCHATYWSSDFAQFY